MAKLSHRGSALPLLQHWFGELQESGRRKAFAPHFELAFSVFCFFFF
jgi:hypothetical protein